MRIRKGNYLIMIKYHFYTVLELSSQKFSKLRTKPLVTLKEGLVQAVENIFEKLFYSKTTAIFYKKRAQN